MKRVKVLGLGNFGFALLHHLDAHAHNIQLTGFTRNTSLLSELSKTRLHPLFPKASPLSQKVLFEQSAEKFLHNTDVLIVAVTSNVISSVMASIKYFINSPIVIVNTAKALDHETGEPYSKIIGDILYDKPHKYAHLAGATLAHDIIAGVPLGIHLAMSDSEGLDEIAKLFSSQNLRVFPTRDLAGVEYASAFKNVIAIFSGIMQGMGYAPESIIYATTQVAREVEILAIEEYNASSETFTLSSPCWGNDLWMSCTSNTRNRELGVRIGKKQSLQELLMEMELQKKTVEGVYTIRVLDKIAPLEKYPFLKFLFALFHGDASLTEIDTLLQNTPA